MHSAMTGVGCWYSCHAVIQIKRLPTGLGLKTLQAYWRLYSPPLTWNHLSRLSHLRRKNGKANLRFSILSRSELMQNLNNVHCSEEYFLDAPIPWVYKKYRYKEHTTGQKNYTKGKLCFVPM